MSCLSITFSCRLTLMSIGVTWNTEMRDIFYVLFHLRNVELKCASEISQQPSGSEDRQIEKKQKFSSVNNDFNIVIYNSFPAGLLALCLTLSTCDFNSQDNPRQSGSTWRHMVWRTRHKCWSNGAQDAIHLGSLFCSERTVHSRP